MTGQLIVAAPAEGPVLHLTEGLSFWGGTDPATGRIIDAHHPQHGADLAGKVVVMPTTRGSCSGSGGLLDLALAGKAPAALIFSGPEDIVTVGALVATQLFQRPIAVARLAAADHAAVARAATVRITDRAVLADGVCYPLRALDVATVALTPADRALLDGQDGPAPQIAMQMIRTVAAIQGAPALTDVTRVHIDGCIHNGGGNLRFADTMAQMGGKVRVPTTMNAISVDYAGWKTQGVDPAFGQAGQQLADAYLAMGAQPSFTCAPYQADDAPHRAEALGWSESNAVVYANSILGARTVKHPDYFDLFIALTGRAPLSGVYLPEHRVARRVIDVTLPAGFDDAMWPLLGWLVGQAAPDCIPLVRGLDHTTPGPDDFRALCAAFGTTSAAPMLHLAGITPEGDLPPAPDADRVALGPDDFRRAWAAFNPGPDRIDLVALGSPHASLTELRGFADLMQGQPVAPGVTVIVTLGRAVLQQAAREGLTRRLTDAGVRLIPDLCWCSITEPVFPPGTTCLMTNSGKYAHYAPGLHGRAVRFGSLAACADAARTGQAAPRPAWLRG